ncbi:MAG: hypothetical protein JXB47_11790 [Anaerolineae bacterium]|nr:hypothetical protein [Anaerolineae bacterium]
MSSKRRGAAEVFREQNIAIQQQEADSGDMEEAAAAKFMAPAVQKSAKPPGAPAPSGGGYFKTSEELQMEKEPIRVRETGFLFWQRVVVPPNVYVVHTRSGHDKPITLGLGLSFRYNPYTDAYLVVPAAMQTIGVIANCISKEKQGINVLAYVQWQIHDFSVAYRKLDFSDSRDPLAIVNAQLREQAEAAIKDKIATMSVEEVLTDKEPIIEELTTRLKVVAEGRTQGKGEGDEGLGIKIVTVQIKEALVSSRALWENLQAPFRYEKEKTARMSYLETQDAIRQKELDTRQTAETSEAETMVEIERIKQTKQTEAVQWRMEQEAARYRHEQESKQEKIALEERTILAQRESQQRLAAQQAQAEQTSEIEQARLAAEASSRKKALEVDRALAELSEEERLEVEQLRAQQEAFARKTVLQAIQSDFDILVQAQMDQLETAAQKARLDREWQNHAMQLEMEEATNRAKIALLEREAEIERQRQEIRNMANERDAVTRLIGQLPEIASHLPEVDELRVFQTGGADGYDGLAAFLAQVTAVAESLGLKLPRVAGDHAK